MGGEGGRLSRGLRKELELSWEINTEGRGGSLKDSSALPQSSAEPIAVLPVLLHPRGTDPVCSAPPQLFLPPPSLPGSQRSAHPQETPRPAEGQQEQGQLQRQGRWLGAIRAQLVAFLG